jgi:PAS domain S-box-containing protein
MFGSRQEDTDMDTFGDNYFLPEVPSELRRKITELAVFHDIVEKANSIILRWDIKGNITFLNEYGLTFFGYTAEEIIGKNVVGTIVPETERSGRDLTAMIDDLIAHPNQYVTNENENVKKNGERIWIAWTNRAITDKNGLMTGLLSVGNDISARKKRFRIKFVFFSSSSTQFPIRFSIKIPREYTWDATGRSRNLRVAPKSR